MAKIDLKRSKKAEEEAEEREEEEEEQDEDEEAEEEEEEAAAPARPVTAEQRRARMRERRTHASGDDHGHDVDPHSHDADEEVDHSNDPTWWAPHAVLGALILIGIFGFFGAFNKVAEKLGYKGMANLTPPVETSAPAKPPVPSTPPPRPTPMQMPQQDQGQKFGAKHLLVMYKGSMRAPEAITRTKEEAKARAEEALKKARAGTKFEDLVKEYSDEPGAAMRGGDLGTFTKGRMVPAFQDGVEKTKVGAVSDLVETPFGFHVILRTQ